MNVYPQKYWEQKSQIHHGFLDLSNVAGEWVMSSRNTPSGEALDKLIGRQFGMKKQKNQM